MAGNTLETTVTVSEMFFGRTVFEISDETETNFSKVSLGSDQILPLQPVHYKYIDPTAKHPRKFAVLGEYQLTGKKIFLFG